MNRGVFKTAVGHKGDMFFMKRQDKIIKIFFNEKKCKEYTDKQNENILEVT